MYSRVAIVDRIGIRTVSRYGYRTVRTTYNRTDLTGGCCGCSSNHPANGLGIAEINICIVRQHVARGIATGRAVGNPTGFNGHLRIVESGWCIVLSLDSDDDLRGRAQSSSIHHRIRKSVRQRVGRRSQGFDGRIVIIDDVRVRTVRRYTDTPVRANNRRTNRTGWQTSHASAHGRHRFGVTAVHIEIIGQYIASWIVACRIIR